ncbi:hypothetical protein [Gimesia panareensis]|uniref:hypothetical protein n=1 Tax=Gimesia panareensis TaxID=2527978 RepID=UPI00118BEFD3|nr:hypothetical protein [Gimesia panareensis]QDU52370.1 hypothetical protein Pan110_47470 [Gimesia panareensis]
MILAKVVINQEAVLSIPLEYATLLVLIFILTGAIFLRLAVKLFNRLTVDESRNVSVPSFLKAAGIAVAGILGSVIIAFLINAIVAGILEESPGERRYGILLYYLAPYFVGGFFIYIGIVSSQLLIPFKSTVKIVLLEYLIRVFFFASVVIILITSDVVSLSLS